jgi:hypothetical protein
LAVLQPSPSTTRESGVLRYVPPPLLHANQACDADVLREEAKDHFARWPALQAVAEILTVLRGADVSWWEPVQLCERWPVGERLHWLEQRADIREEISRSLTGIALRAGRRRSVSFQAELIEAMADPVLDARRVEEAFDPRDLVVYGPVNELWDEIMASIPWDAELRPALIEQLLEILLADRSTVLGPTTMRPPILSPLLLRTAVDTRAWQAHLPARLRAAVDDARLHRELVDPGAPFTARDELEIVTVGGLAASLPLRALRPVFSAAARLMGLEHPAPARSEPAPKGQFDEIANDGDLEDVDMEVTVSTG